MRGILADRLEQQNKPKRLGTLLDKYKGILERNVFGKPRCALTPTAEIALRSIEREGNTQAGKLRETDSALRDGALQPVFIGTVVGVAAAAAAFFGVAITRRYLPGISIEKVAKIGVIAIIAVPLVNALGTMIYVSKKIADFAKGLAQLGDEINHRVFLMRNDTNFALARRRLDVIKAAIDRMMERAAEETWLRAFEWPHEKKKEDPEPN